jgi:hypothetical protein
MKERPGTTDYLTRIKLHKQAGIATAASETPRLFSLRDRLSNPGLVWPGKSDSGWQVSDEYSARLRR